MWLSGAAVPHASPCNLLLRRPAILTRHPSQAVHLILLPTDKLAQRELGHELTDWMGVGASAAELEEAAEREREVRRERRG